jgi:DNA-binding SARP family transcriptional activator
MLFQEGEISLVLWTDTKLTVFLEGNSVILFPLTGRYDDGRFVLDKHTELDSYSTGSLKQQSTGRYDDGRFVLDHHIYLWTVVSVSQHYKNPTQRVCLVQSHYHHIDSYSAGSLKQQSTGRYDDGRFVLDKHAELDSYSAGSLKLPVDCCFSEPVL